MSPQDIEQENGDKIKIQVGDISAENDSGVNIAGRDVDARRVEAGTYIEHATYNTRPGLLIGGVLIILVVIVVFLIVFPDVIRGTSGPSKTQTDLSLIVNPTITHINKPTEAPTQPLATQTEEEIYTDTLQPTALPSQIVVGFDVPMALVPAGEFVMGSQDFWENERPQHRVSLDDFYIDVYEVTNSQYAVCVQANVCDPPWKRGSSARVSYYDSPSFADYPVVYVNWQMAQTYCQWRGAKLPSEAQWEKAARGGLDGALYPWGNESPDCQLVNYFDAEGMCLGDTGQVGSYEPNGYGLYDMAGNVWEWVLDLYESGYYAVSPAKNPSGPNQGNEHVLRGGSYLDDLDDMRTAYRGWLDPVSADSNLGFRCARSP